MSLAKHRQKQPSPDSHLYSNKRSEIYIGSECWIWFLHDFGNLISSLNQTKLTLNLLQRQLLFLVVVKLQIIKHL